MLPSAPACKAFPAALSKLAAKVLFLFAGMFLASAAAGQERDQKPESAPGMGVSTGVAHPAVKDSKSRPITAGGFVDNAPVVFEDVTRRAGLEKFRHRSGTPEKSSII
jgi:hypothetical protein